MTVEMVKLFLMSVSVIQTLGERIAACEILDQRRDVEGSFVQSPIHHISLILSSLK
jgi:predicted RNA-binding protein